MNKVELIITNEDIELLKEMKNNCLKTDVYNDEKRLLKANAITKFLMLQQENNKLKEKISLLNTTNEKNYNKYCDLLKEKQELRSWLEEQYQEYKETEDERGIVLTSYTIDKLNELSGE